MEQQTDRQEQHVVVKSPVDNAVDLLHGASRISKQGIKAAMTKGAVWLTRGRNTQRLRRAKRKLRAGDEIHLYYDPKVLAQIPAEPALVADVGGYSVWNKPFGLRSQGSKWGDHCTVSRWAERHLLPERPAFIVHRLDRAASGLILVAHTKTIAAALAELFRNRSVEKRYQAWVAGDFSGQQTPLRVEQPIDEKNAASEFSFIKVENGRSLIDVRIETGRKHQIRRHLAVLGYPIVGDRLYGDGAKDGLDLQLTAYLLAFRCPINDEVVDYRLSLETRL